MLFIIKFPDFTFLKTRTILLSVLLLLAYRTVLAQFTDNFSDGDLKANPTWQGDTTWFTVDAGQLRSSGPDNAGIIYASTKSRSINQASWEFFIDLKFAPSNDNQVKVYLCSDRPDLTGELNGYYLLLGQSGDDFIRIYRQDGNTVSHLFTGATAFSGNITMRVRVTRDDHGNWEVLSDPAGGMVFTAEGPGFVDNTHLSTAYFGIVCKFSVTRKDLFYFDDFEVFGDPFVDNIAPSLVSVEAIGKNQLSVHFNEPVAPGPALGLQNYEITQGLGHPVEAVMESPGNVYLRFSGEFVNGVESELSAAGIADTAGNVASLQTRKFLYFVPVEPDFKAVVVNEIFADPSPQVSLPASEYIELYNRDEHPFQLEGWTLSDGRSTATIGSYLLLPRQYVILYPQSLAHQFTAFEKKVAADNWPTLNNAGDRLVLRSAEGNLVDSLDYLASWYQDEDKATGGWSLEMIYPENLCGEETNWIVSLDDSGGTPGKINSVFAEKPDLTGPKLEQVIAVDEYTLVLIFNESLDESSPVSPAVTIEPSLSWRDLSFSTGSRKKLRLELTEKIQPGTIYTIRLGSLFDCNHNPVNKEFASQQFALPETASHQDLVINEILFNPRPGGVDFIEVYNRSEKFINLKQWQLAGGMDSTSLDTEIITGSHYLIGPGKFLVLTSDGDILKADYPHSREETFLLVRPLPTYRDDQGNVSLMDSTGARIDFLTYDESYHFEFIKDPEGVSLERVFHDRPSENPNNWKSAASTKGFATPGFQNSQSGTGSNLTQDNVHVDPRVIVPDFSGRRDYTTIHYQFDHHGFIANVRIFDLKGRLIKTIANNDLIDTAGFYTWDGTAEDGSVARVGTYLLIFQVFTVDGQELVFKDRVVVGKEF